MKKDNILSIKTVGRNNNWEQVPPKQLVFLYSFPVQEPIWVMEPDGNTHRVYSIETYNLIPTSDLDITFDIKVASYFDTYSSYTLPNEIVIGGDIDDITFNDIEIGELLQESDLLKAVFKLKQIELEEKE